jgi:glycosyltransferase involved in cell wall biosynthesis
VADETSALIIPIRSTQSIKVAILSLYKNVSLRNSLGLKARQKIEKYTWDYYQENLVKQYKRLLKLRNKN